MPQVYITSPARADKSRVVISATRPSSAHCRRAQCCASRRVNEVFFGKERACRKLRVHVVAPNTHRDDQPDPKYRTAIQAVASANAVTVRSGENKLPQTLSHHGTQTTPVTTEANSLTSRRSSDSPPPEMLNRPSRCLKKATRKKSSTRRSHSSQLRVDGRAIGVSPVLPPPSIPPPQPPLYPPLPSPLPSPQYSPAIVPPYCTVPPPPLPSPPIHPCNWQPTQYQFHNPYTILSQGHPSPRQHPSSQHSCANRHECDQAMPHPGTWSPTCGEECDPYSVDISLDVSNGRSRSTPKHVTPPSPFNVRLTGTRGRSTHNSLSKSESRHASQRLKPMTEKQERADNSLSESQSCSFADTNSLSTVIERRVDRKVVEDVVCQVLKQLNISKCTSSPSEFKINQMSSSTRVSGPQLSAKQTAKPSVQFSSTSKNFGYASRNSGYASRNFGYASKNSGYTSRNFGNIQVESRTPDVEGQGSPLKRSLSDFSSSESSHFGQNQKVLERAPSTSILTTSASQKELKLISKLRDKRDSLLEEIRRVDEKISQSKKAVNH